MMVLYNEEPIIGGFKNHVRGKFREHRARDTSSLKLCASCYETKDSVQSYVSW